MSARAALPPAGLCADCRHAELVASARSRFLRCGRSDDDPEFPRYPTLPVLRCRGYVPAEPASDADGRGLS